MNLCILISDGASQNSKSTMLQWQTSMCAGSVRRVRRLALSPDLALHERATGPRKPIISLMSSKPNAIGEELPANAGSSRMGQQDGPVTLCALRWTVAGSLHNCAAAQPRPSKSVISALKHTSSRTHHAFRHKDYPHSLCAQELVRTTQVSGTRAIIACRVD